MSAFSLEDSLERAQRRLGRATRRRSDRGTSRFPQEVDRWLTTLLHGREKPRFTQVHRELRELCDASGLPTPTRSSLYNAVRRVRVPEVRWDALPETVQTSLYNLEPNDPGDLIPGDQVVFHAFNYGEPRALSFASAMPWLCLVRADTRRGWRPKSHALLRSVMRYRGL